MNTTHKIISCAVAALAAGSAIIAASIAVGADRPQRVDICPAADTDPSCDIDRRPNRSGSDGSKVARLPAADGPPAPATADVRRLTALQRRPPRDVRRLTALQRRPPHDVRRLTALQRRPPRDVRRLTALQRRPPRDVRRLTALRRRPPPRRPAADGPPAPATARRPAADGPPAPATAIWTGDTEDHPGYGPANPASSSGGIDVTDFGCLVRPWHPFIACPGITGTTDPTDIPDYN